MRFLLEDEGPGIYRADVFRVIQPSLDRYNAIVEKEFFVLTWRHEVMVTKDLSNKAHAGSC